MTPALSDMADKRSSSSGVLIALVVCGISGGIIGFLVALALAQVFGSACK